MGGVVIGLLVVFSCVYLLAQFFTQELADGWQDDDRGFDEGGWK